MKRVEFIKDFATRVKGDVLEFEDSLCNHLVNIDEVAQYTEKELKAKEYEGPREYLEYPEQIEAKKAKTKPVIQDEQV